MTARSATSDLWRPLRTPIFRQLLIADVVSDIGTFMQGVGSAWLMVSIGATPLFIALTQTASTLPFFLFALPAGAIGDIVDRRALILYTEAWMLCVATAIAVATIGGLMTPWLLLALTFALSAGDAVESPTWRAVLPELVRREDLPAASALNGIEFNIARAVGPALAGALIAAAGVGAAFLVNVISFFGVIVVVARWNRPFKVATCRIFFDGDSVRDPGHVTALIPANATRCDICRWLRGVELVVLACAPELGHVRWASSTSPLRHRSPSSCRLRAARRLRLRADALRQLLAAGLAVPFFKRLVGDFAFYK